MTDISLQLSLLSPLNIIVFIFSSLPPFLSLLSQYWADPGSGEAAAAMLAVSQL